MACSNEISNIQTKCDTIKVKSVMIFNSKDVVMSGNGIEITSFRVKRKYGKFTRPVIKYSPDDIQALPAENVKSGLILKK